MTIRDKMRQIAADLELAATGLRDESFEPLAAIAIVRQSVTHARHKLEDLEYEAKYPLPSGPTASPEKYVAAPKDHL